MIDDDVDRHSFDQKGAFANRARFLQSRHDGDAAIRPHRIPCADEAATDGAVKCPKPLGEHVAEDLVGRSPPVTVDGSRRVTQETNLPPAAACVNEVVRYIAHSAADARGIVRERSRMGLRTTSPIGVQLRVGPVQWASLRCGRAWSRGCRDGHPTVNAWATAVPVAFFATAVGTHAVHGALRDTDNQLARPRRLGAHTLPSPLVAVYMVALIFGEIGGFLVLFAGFLRHLAAA